MYLLSKIFWCHAWFYMTQQYFSWSGWQWEQGSGHGSVVLRKSEKRFPFCFEQLKLSLLLQSSISQWPCYWIFIWAIKQVLIPFSGTKSVIVEGWFLLIKGGGRTFKSDLSFRELLTSPSVCWDISAVQSLAFATCTCTDWAVWSDHPHPTGNRDPMHTCGHGCVCCCWVWQRVGMCQNRSPWVAKVRMSLCFNISKVCAVSTHWLISPGLGSHGRIYQWSHEPVATEIHRESPFQSLHSQWCPGLLGGSTLAGGTPPHQVHR